MANLTYQQLLSDDCSETSGYALCHAATWILKTIPIALLRLGTCGNVLSLIVLSRKRLRKYSTTIYLLFLAGSDLTLLWLSLLRRVLQFVAQVDIRNSSEFQCRTNEWLAMTSGSFSIWILVLLTIERAVFTQSPVLAKSKMTRTFAFVLCLVFLTIIALINGHYMFGKHIRLNITPTYDAEKTDQQNHTSIIDDVGQSASCYYVSESYKLFAEKLFPAVGLGVFNVLPGFLIFTGNISILIKLRQQRRKLQPMTHNVNYVGYNRNAKATRMLFVLCGFFLVTTTPYSVYFTVYFVVRGGLSDQAFAGIKLGFAIVMVFLWSNFSLNFFLYFVSGSLFKKEWNLLLAELKDKISSIFEKKPNLHVDTMITMRPQAQFREGTENTINNCSPQQIQIQSSL